MHGVQLQNVLSLFREGCAVPKRGWWGLAQEGLGAHRGVESKVESMG